MNRYADHTPEERRAYMLAANKAYRARKGTPVRTPRTVPTATATRMKQARGEVWSARVLEVDHTRTYVGIYDTKEEALQVCADYIATGVKPPPATRGMKRGQQKRPGSMTRWGTPVLLTDQQAKPLSTAERLARTGGSVQRYGTATARATVPTGQDSPKAATGLKTRQLTVELSPAERWKRVYAERCGGRVA